MHQVFLNFGRFSSFEVSAMKNLEATEQPLQSEAANEEKHSIS